ncbi:MAG: Iron-sulfur cluster assembly accessory protein [Clostridia bacterium 62_21]|nr:MAG: Iron-sulfur cluster assembly accessory protein [Clostridia bacterium 62_21]
MVEIDGLKFVADREAARYLSGAVIDYGRSWFGSGFTIRGTHEGSCSC